VLHPTTNMLTRDSTVHRIIFQAPFIPHSIDHLANDPVRQWNSELLKNHDSLHSPLLANHWDNIYSCWPKP
jgi:hypothetical protein